MNDKSQRNTSVSESSMSHKIVSTLTFHEAMNYGAVLQTYALQQAILRLGVDTEVINYSCPSIARRYRLKKTVKGLIGWLLGYRTRKKRSAQFRTFLDSHVKMSVPVTRDDLPALCKQYDSVIVGSDQVWNHEITGDDRTYLLDFLQPDKRKAYAASLGTLQSFGELENEYTRELNLFSRISTREESAANYLEPLLGNRPSVVCDPTFLIPIDSWSIIAKTPGVNNPFVLLYTFGMPTDDCISWAKRKARALDCKLISISLAKAPTPGIKCIRDAGPAEFLGYIQEAEYVITTSYHGCCFSILFNKDFCWFSHDAGSERAMAHGTRAKEMFASLGLTERFVNKDTEDLGSIDYGAVNKRIDEFRAASMRVLEEML